MADSRVTRSRKILFLSHRIPFPPNKGDKIRSYNLLRWLSRTYEVYVGCLVDDACDLAYVEEVRGMTCELAYARVTRLRRFGAGLLAIAGGRSVSVKCFHSWHLQERIDAWIGDHEFQAILCSSSPMAEYLFRSRHYADRSTRAVRIMDLIDVDSMKWAQYAAASHWWKSWLFAHEAKTLAAYESRIMGEFDRVLVVTEQERSCFADTGRLSRVVVIPNGVDLSFFHAGENVDREHGGPTLVFTGVMDYWPNIDGVTWFCHQILPLIRAEVPSVRFNIVGNRPSSAVRALGQLPNVMVTGFVEDVREYFRKADVCVVPLRIARGIQNKILEGMAMGLPVVTTLQAFEGIRAHVGRDILVGRDEIGFAREVIGLLQDDGLRQSIGMHARVAMEANYSWDRNLAPVAAMIEGDALAQSAGGGNCANPSFRTMTL